MPSILSPPLPDVLSAGTLEEGGSICGLISRHLYAAAQVPAAPGLKELGPCAWLARLGLPTHPAS